MQAGWIMFEVGSVQLYHHKSVLKKYIICIVVCGLGFYSFGYGFAFGNMNNPIIGSSQFFMIDSNLENFIQYWGFLLNTLAIINGVLTQRTKLTTYIIISLSVSIIIFPLLVHWFWSPEGWFSPYGNPRKMYVIDFAGGGVVHMCAGVYGFVASKYFIRNKAQYNGQSAKGPSIMFMAIGVIFLYFGFFGFNTGAFRVYGSIAAKITMNTIISAFAGGIIGYLGFIIIPKVSFKKLDANVVRRWKTRVATEDAILNGVLCGLVSTTSSCVFLFPSEAVLVATIGYLFYAAISLLLFKMNCQDPLDGVAIHFGCGLVSMLSVVICDGPTIEYIIKTIHALEQQNLSQPAKLISFVYYGWAWQLLNQLIAILVIIVLTGLVAYIIFSRIPEHKRNIAVEEQASSTFYPMGLDPRVYNPEVSPKRRDYENEDAEPKSSDYKVKFQYYKGGELEFESIKRKDTAATIVVNYEDDINEEK